MSIPTELRYSESHEWLAQNDDGTLTVGITEYAQAQLGDVVFVETPVVDNEAEAEDAIAVIESVKAASDLYAPLAGTIIDANAELADNPELINDSPYTGGWIFKMKPVDNDAWEELMDAEAYEHFIDSSED